MFKKEDIPKKLPHSSLEAKYILLVEPAYSAPAPTHPATSQAEYEAPAIL